MTRQPKLRVVQTQEHRFVIQLNQGLSWVRIDSFTSQEEAIQAAERYIERIKFKPKILWSTQ